LPNDFRRHKFNLEFHLSSASICLRCLFARTDHRISAQGNRCQWLSSAQTKWHHHTNSIRSRRVDAMAWQGLPRLHCCAGSSLRCSGRAMRWAASSVQQSALHHHADVTAASGQLHVPQCRAGTPLAAVPLQQRRRPLRTMCSSAGTAAGSNGSSEAEGRFVITTPLYYVNAGAFVVFALSWRLHLQLLAHGRKDRRPVAIIQCQIVHHSGCSSASGWSLLHDGCRRDGAVPGAHFLNPADASA